MKLKYYQLSEEKCILKAWKQLKKKENVNNFNIPDRRALSHF